MASLRYLNGILTVLAVLLTLNLWIGWSASPGGQTLSIAQPAQAEGLVNPAQQREEILGELKKVNVQLAAMRKTMTDGSMRVQAFKQGDDHSKQSRR